MPGGLLNLVAWGNQNVYLNGNPSKTFFKTTYSKYTNFGLQKFRIDFEGSRNLKLTEESVFNFKIPRYADLLMDTYIVVNLPNIWSPIYPPKTNDSNAQSKNRWAPYEFKWIKDLGAEMIREITITCGGQTLQKYSGTYLKNMVDRDFTKDQKELFNKMSGNIPELNNPGNVGARVNAYPNAFYDDSEFGASPSIASRKLYIPINTWFTNSTKTAFPLVAMQYNELHINITFRPVQELFTIRDVNDVVNEYPYIKPNFNVNEFQMYRFLQKPPNVTLEDEYYVNKNVDWVADIHLMSTYCFLSDDESRLFAKRSHQYLIKEIHEYKFENVTGSQKVVVDTLGMVSSWMFHFQRSDVNLRNEWSNYTNWPYDFLPNEIQIAPNTGHKLPYISELSDKGPNTNLDNTVNNFFITSSFNSSNQKEILQDFGVLFNGNYRENVFPAGIYNYIEKYAKSKVDSNEGLYCYNFCLNTNPFEHQPSGAINMSKFKNVELELSTYVPTYDVSAQFYTICDDQGNIIGVNQPSWRLFDYNFDLYIQEERYNIVVFSNGNCGLLYSR
jgi:hypothetical protein